MEKLPASDAPALLHGSTAGADGLAEAAQGLNVPLSEILQGNLSKLHGRYPNGFSSERSMHRENAE